MMSLRGQAGWVKMMSLVSKITAPACHPTKYVNKAEHPTYLTTDIGRKNHMKKATGKFTKKSFMSLVLAEVKRLK